MGQQYFPDTRLTPVLEWVIHRPSHSSDGRPRAPPPEAPQALRHDPCVTPGTKGSPSTSAEGTRGMLSVSYPKGPPSGRTRHWGRSTVRVHTTPPYDLPALDKRGLTSASSDSRTSSGRETRRLAGYDPRRNGDYGSPSTPSMKKTQKYQLPDKDEDTLKRQTKVLPDTETHKYSHRCSSHKGGQKDRHLLQRCKRLS